MVRANASRSADIEASGWWQVASVGLGRANGPAAAVRQVTWRPQVLGK
jgi:hypothetical protein